MVCTECIAKLNALKIPYKLKVSPYTGKLAPMIQGRPLIVTEPIAGQPDLELFKTELTNQMLTQSGVDSFCDAVDYIGGNTQATFLPSVWTAVDVTSSGKLMVIGPDGRLIMGWDDFVIILVTILTTSQFWIAVIGVIVLAAIIVVVGYLSREPQYNFEDPNGNPDSGSWTEFISNQNAKYWFVCSKDGFGIGERSTYASPTDVPETEIAVFNEHCNNAPDISPPEWFETLLMQIVYVGIVIGGIYVAIKVLPSLFRGQTKKSND